MRALFTHRAGYYTRFILFIALSIIMMTVDHRQNRLTQVRAALSWVVTPIEYFVSSPFSVFEYFTKLSRGKAALLEENAELKREQLLLNVKAQRLDALTAENARLRVLLDAVPRTGGDRVLVAELLKVDLDPFSHRILLNKGSLDDVYIGQPVVDDKGVMGQVIYTGPMTSVVLLLTDVRHAIPIEATRSGARAIAMGTGAFDQLLLSNVTQTSDFKVGDLLVTSGLDGRFPEGYPVGIIESIDYAPGNMFAHVVVKPVAALDKHHEVLLIWPHKTSGENETAAQAAAHAADADASKKTKKK